MKTKLSTVTLLSTLLLVGSTVYAQNDMKQGASTNEDVKVYQVAKR